MSTTYYSTFHPAESSGTKGSAAFAGSALNTAVIYLYRRSATALTAGDKPNASTIYTFDSPSINLTGVTNGWTSTIPAGSDPLYAVTITVASDNATVTITTAEWATPVVLAQNGANGINAVSGFLTNEAHNVSADLNGANYSLTGSGGTFKVFNGITDVTTSATFSVVAPATKNGLTISIGAGTGIFSLSGASWTTDSENFTLRAVYNTVTIDLVYSISKSKTGSTGAQGPSLKLTASAQAFTFTDSVANPGSQTITLTATLQNLTGTATFTTTPTVTLTGTGLTRMLTDVNFGTNRQVTVEVTVAGVTDRITIVRLERNIVINSANRVQNSLFETGTNSADWGSFGEAGVTANPATSSTVGGFAAAVSTGSVPNNTARVIFSSNRRFPVTAGETLFVGVGANTGANTLVTAQVLFENASSTYITELNASQVTASTNGRSTGFITVPAGATQGVLRIQITHTTSGAVTATIYQPMVTSAAAGQTLLPAFTRGLNAQDAATVGAVAGTNLLDSGGRSLTDRDISNTSQRVAVRQWAFNNNSLNGWSGVAQSGSAPTVTTGSEFVTFTANAVDTSFMSPDGLGLDGRVGRYLRMILSATVQLSATMRNVEVYFSTNAYAPIDGTRSKNGDWIPANHPTNGTPFEVLLDMHTLTAGGNAWRDEIVRRVRIDFDGAVPETIRIHEISMVYLGTGTVGAPPGTFVGTQESTALVADAATAKANAATSLSELALIASDAWLTQGEKPAVRIERDAILDEFPTIRDRADAFGVSRTTYATAYTDLIAYLGGLSLDSATNTAIVAATFNTRFRNYYAARETVLDGIALVASQRANMLTSNVVVNSEFTRGIYGFRFAATTASGAGTLYTVYGGVNLNTDYSGIKNVMWASVSTSGANWSSGGYADAFSMNGNWNGGNMTEQRQFGLPVKNGDRVYARCLLARHRCNAQLLLLVFDKNGNYLGSTSTSFTGGRLNGAGLGDPTNFDVVGGTHLITDANAASALMVWRMNATGEADPYIFMTEPAMGIIPSYQTTLPPYQLGNTDPLADATRTTLPSLQRGAWSASSVVYALGDIVTRDGSSYTCIIANTSTGVNGPPGANWSLLAQVGAQGATGVSAPPTKALGTGGAAQFDPILLIAGQTVTVEAELYLNTGGVAGTCSLQVQRSLNGANSWTTMTNGSVSSSLPTSEAVELIIPNATFTNTTGVDQLFDIRTTSTRQSRTVNLPPSFMRVI